MTAEHDRFVAHSLRTSMFFPQSRLFIAGNPKAAGTSMRWWLLNTHGVDVAARTIGSLWGESAPYQTVWDDSADLEYTWSRLPDEAKTDALTSTDVLTVKPVRNPLTRAFSAWAGKYLTLEPYYSDRLPPSFDPPPSTIESAQHITALFDSFVSSLLELAQSSPEWEGIDVHFWPQHRLLARSVVGRDFELKQEDMANGIDRILLQMREHGINAEPMPRLNENVVPYQPEFISEAARGKLVTLYGPDFARYGYPDELPAGSKQELDLPWLNDLRGRNLRYGVVHQIATRNRDRIGELNRELADARRREQELLGSHSWKVTKPLRAVTGRLKRDHRPD